MLDKAKLKVEELFGPTIKVQKEANSFKFHVKRLRGHEALELIKAVDKKLYFVIKRSGTGLTVIISTKPIKD